MSLQQRGNEEPRATTRRPSDDSISPSLAHSELLDGVPLAGFECVHFDELAGVACPCGIARRAFTQVADFPGTVHVTEIHETARRHYHKQLTETYYVLECTDGAYLELDDLRLNVRVGSCILIRPGTRHRAVGRMKVLILVLPKFNEADEWFDDEPASDANSMNTLSNPWDEPRR